MSDDKKPQERRQRGRPATGEAKTPTQRARAFDDALLASGGRVLNRVRLSAEAAEALKALSEMYESERASIEAALIKHAVSVARNVK